MAESTWSGPMPEESATSVSEVAVLPQAERGSIIESIWQAFASLKLALVNIALLGLGMVAGTFLNPSNAPWAEIQRALQGRPVVLWLYRTFELWDLFRSWWFTLLLLSLALNLIACSIERLPRIYLLVKYPEVRLDRVKGLKLRFAAAPTQLSLEQITGKLRDQKYRVHQSAREGGVDVFAERGRYARFGVWVVHLSLLMVLGGGIVGRLFAFEGTSDIRGDGGISDAMVERTGDGTPLRRAYGPFFVRCDEFRLKEFEDGRPKSFESDLVVLEKLPDGEPGRELARQTITVNHPLRYGGLTFYQANYRKLDGEGARARVQLFDKVSGQRRQLMASAGQEIEAEPGLTYSFVDYQQDFANQGEAVQAVRTDARIGKSTSFWVFKSRPDFDRDNREDRFALSFEKLQPLYATGLQVARDPSTPIIYAGCFLLFAGLCVAFYQSHRRVWLRVQGGKVELGGAAHRAPDVFRRELDELRAELLGVDARA